MASTSNFRGENTLTVKDALNFKASFGGGSSASNNSVSGLRTVLRLRPVNNSQQSSSAADSSDNSNASDAKSSNLNNKNCVLERQSQNSVFLRDTRNERYEDKTYSFDHIYDKESTKEVFDRELGERALLPLFDGKHCTVFAHGASGSGKTYTMQGENFDKNITSDGNGNNNNSSSAGDSANNDDPESDQDGFVPRAVKQILDCWEKKDPNKNTYKVYFSLYELYLNCVRDLLQDLPVKDISGRVVNAGGGAWLGEYYREREKNDRENGKDNTSGKDQTSSDNNNNNNGTSGTGSGSGSNNSSFKNSSSNTLTLPKYKVDDLPVQIDKSGEEIVPCLERVTITSLEEFRELYLKRIKLRKTGATSLNQYSSRSHCCIQISVEKIQSKTGGQSNDSESLKAPQMKMSYHSKPVQQQIGKLFMVDLAGCEDNRETDSAGRGARIDESKRINSTYLSLVKVFKALRRGEQLKPVARDDKLTRLLRVALESSGIPTLVLITVYPALHQLQAILNTFSYLNIQPQTGNNNSTINSNNNNNALENFNNNRPTSARRNTEAFFASNDGGGGAKDSGRERGEYEGQNGQNQNQNQEGSANSNISNSNGSGPAGQQSSNNNNHNNNINNNNVNSISTSTSKESNQNSGTVNSLNIADLTFKDADDGTNNMRDDSDSGPDNKSVTPRDGGLGVQQTNVTQSTQLVPPQTVPSQTRMSLREKELKLKRCQSPPVRRPGTGNQETFAPAQRVGGAQDRVATPTRSLGGLTGNNNTLKPSVTAQVRQSTPSRRNLSAGPQHRGNGTPTKMLKPSPTDTVGGGTSEVTVTSDGNHNVTGSGPSNQGNTNTSSNNNQTSLTRTLTGNSRRTMAGQSRLSVRGPYTRDMSKEEVDGMVSDSGGIRAKKRQMGW